MPAARKKAPSKRKPQARSKSARRRTVVVHATPVVEKPRAARDGLKCPLWKKEKHKVCHTCEFWVRLYGRNPNPKDPHTIEMIDDWRCAISWGPVLSTQLAYEIGCISKEMSAQRAEVLPAMQGVFHSTQIAASASQALTKAITEASQQRAALPAARNGHDAAKLIEG